jgi:fatty acid desaturase
MLVPPEEESSAKRDSLRLFAIANAVILPAGLVIVWATGMVGSDIDWQGWIAVALALLVTSLLGSGLMTLAFYSSRTDRDEVAHRVPESDADHEHR